MNNTMTPTEKLTSLQSRITKLNNEKISAQTSLKHLREQYDTKIARLKSLGVQNTSNLSAELKTLEENLSRDLDTLDRELTQIERSVFNEQ